MSEIVVIARIQAKPGRGAELLALFSELAPRVLATEPETLRYAFLVEPNPEPVRVTVIEGYASQAALEVHNSGVLTEYLPRLTELCDGAPDLVELRPAALAVTVDDARLNI